MEIHDNIVGIYKITSPSGKVYIGQSINIEKRWYRYNHLDCKSQIKLYNSFKKYGPNDHVFEILEKCSEEQLLERETYWKLFYKVLEIPSLCCRIDGKSGKDGIETKLRKSKAKKGISKPEDFGLLISKLKKGKTLNYKRSQEHNNKLISYHFKPILQFNINDEFIKEWISLKEAELFLNPKEKLQNNISSCCRGRQKTAYGFKWKYKVKIL